MSRVIDTAGALVAAPAGSAPPWETIFSEKGTINRYNPPGVTDRYWRNSDYDRIKIDWFFANNGVRLYAPGNYTRIAGTLLSQSGNNATSHWVHSIPNTTQAIVPGAQTTSNHNGQVQSYNHWVAGEIQLHRNTDQPDLLARIHQDRHGGRHVQRCHRRRLHPPGPADGRERSPVHVAQHHGAHGLALTTRDVSATLVPWTTRTPRSSSRTTSANS